MSQGRRKYGIDTMLKAMEKVRNGMSAYKASILFQIPRTTLRDHMSGKAKGFDMGPARMLSFDEENSVIEYIQYMTKRNFPLRRSDLRSVIVDLITKSGAERVGSCLFNLEKGPSDEWFGKFQNRHDEIKWVVPQTIDRRRSSQSNEFVIDHFFTLYESVIKDLKLEHKPQCIFNCDETAITSHIATRQKAYGLKGCPLFQEKVTNLDHITAMMAVSASGRVLPTFLIYEKNMPCVALTDQLPHSWMYGTSPNGYMDKELFKIWFRDIFVKNCGRERPVLLVLDNHDSHFSEDVITEAKKNQIELLGLPAHTTHIIQPLDVGIFAPLKRKYNSICVSAGQLSACARITRTLFPTTWKNCIIQACTPNIIKSAFRRSGLYPFDPTAIDRTKVRKQCVVSLQEASSSSVQTITIVPTGEQNLDPDSTNITDLESNPILTQALQGEVPPEPCDKCGRLPHPLPSARKLPADLQECFPIPDTAPPSKKRRISNATLGRVITGAQVSQQIIQKEKQIKDACKAKEDRKNKVMLNKSKKASLNVNKAGKSKILEQAMTSSDTSTSKNVLVDPSYDPPTSLDTCSKDLPKRKSLHLTCTANVKANKALSKVTLDPIDQSICHACMSEVPPIKKGLRTKGKRGKQVIWVGCDHCERWYHKSCVGIANGDNPEDFKCSVCEN